MGEVLSALTTRDEPPDPDATAWLSPMLHGHLNLLGHYHFELSPPVAAGERRALRLPEPDRGPSGPR